MEKQSIWTLYTTKATLITISLVVVYHILSDQLISWLLPESKFAIRAIISLTQICVILIPTVILMKGDFKQNKILSLTPLKDYKLISLAIIAVISIQFANFTLTEILQSNYIFGNDDTKSMYETMLLKQYEMFNWSNGLEYLYTMVFFALVPAIAEELLFRGFLLRKLTEMKIGDPVITVSILFAFLHFNHYNFAGLVMLSVLLCYITIETKSLVPAIVIHFLNNSGSLILYNTDIYESTSSYFDSQNIILMLIIFSVSAIVMYFTFFNRFKHIGFQKQNKPNYEESN